MANLLPGYQFNNKNVVQYIFFDIMVLRLFFEILDLFLLIMEKLNDSSTCESLMCGCVYAYMHVFSVWCSVHDKL